MTRLDSNFTGDVSFEGGATLGHYQHIDPAKLQAFDAPLLSTREHTVVRRSALIAQSISRLIAPSPAWDLSLNALFRTEKSRTIISSDQ